MESILDKELDSYFSQLNELQKKSLLNMIKSFLQSNVKTLESITIAEYNEDLDNSMLRINQGHFASLESLEKEMQEW